MKLSDNTPHQYILSTHPSIHHINPPINRLKPTLLITLPPFSFQVEDVMESRASLFDLIKNKTLHDLQAQLAQLAGSLTVIGSPMGFARKVGTGVKSFFYEPYQGAVHSPHDFVVGLGRGTSNLFQNVVSGAMNSTVALVGTASKVTTTPLLPPLYIILPIPLPMLLRIVSDIPSRPHVNLPPPI